MSPRVLRTLCLGVTTSTTPRRPSLQERNRIVVELLTEAVYRLMLEEESQERAAKNASPVAHEGGR